MNIHNLKYSLLAFCMAFVAACAADPHIDAARENLATMNYEGVMEAAQEAINTNPESGDGYFYMGVALGQQALDMPPADRRAQYAQAREYLDQAKERYEAAGETGGEAAEIAPYILDIWGHEHNLGVSVIADDFVSTETDSLILSEYHLYNAVTINPDSVQSYSILYEVNYLLGNVEAAIANAERVVFELGSDDLYNYYRLSYFYQETGNDQQALAVLNAAHENYPENTEVVQELANLYLNMGDTDRALETVQNLIDTDPNNPQYRLVYGTQVYQLVLNMDDQMSDYYDELFEVNQSLREARRNQNTQRVNELEQRAAEINAQIDELQAEVDRFTDRAEEELKVAAELEPQNPVAHSTLGIIYQNRAAAKFERRNATEDYDLADQLDKEARELLHVAIPHYERATEIEPENTENWMSLFRIYTTLGMNEEAERAQERAGL